MRFLRSGLSVIVLVLACLGGTPQIASAASSDHGRALAQRIFVSSDPYATFTTLSATDKAAFRAYETPAKVDTTTIVKPLTRNATPSPATVSAAYSGCWAMQNSTSAKNVFGGTLYSYGQSTEVCVSGGSVYYVLVYNVWHSVSAPGWRWDHDKLSTFNAGWEGRGLAQFEFILGSGGWDIEAFRVTGAHGV